MLNVAENNSVACFMEKVPHVYQENQKRPNFQSDLSEELCKPQIDRCFLAEQAKQPKHILVFMGAFVSEQMERPSQH